MTASLSLSEGYGNYAHIQSTHLIHPILTSVMGEEVLFYTFSRRQCCYQAYRII